MSDAMKNDNEVFETKVEGVAEGVRLPETQCLLDMVLESCTLVITGGSGDLTARKLMPSLFEKEIVIQFKDVPHAMFRHSIGEHIPGNRLTQGIYPEKRITLTFQTKNPGAKLWLRSVTMDFHYHQGYKGPVLDAYEKVLLDVMTGDHVLFWRQEGVELCWSFLTPVLEGCELCDNREEMLLTYKAGSWGPDVAGEFLKKRAKSD